MRDVLGYNVQDENGNIIGASGSVQVIRKTVKGFFRSLGINDLVINGKIETIIGDIPIITHDQLKRILEATGNPRNRALILTAKDSGLRESDLLRLKVGHIREALNDIELEFLTFEILPWKNRKKSKIKANPCLGPESLDAIRKWMIYRTEKLGISAKDADPLFCATENRKGSSTRRGVDKPGTKKGDQLRDGTPGTRFYYLVRKVGLEEAGISFHSMRKFLQTQLEWAQVPPNWINRITGRKGRGTSGIYSRPNPAQIREIYGKAYHTLRLDREGASIQEVQNLQNQIDLQQHDLDSLRQFKSTVQNFLQRERDLEKQATQLAVEKIRELQEKGFKSIVPKGFVEYKPGLWASPDDNPDDDPPTLEQLLKNDSIQQQNSTNGDHLIVNSEQEMLLHLNKGYELIKELSNDRYLLKQQ
jgi:hypothetical protein